MHRTNSDCWSRRAGERDTRDRSPRADSRTRTFDRDRERCRDREWDRDRDRDRTRERQREQEQQRDRGRARTADSEKDRAGRGSNAPTAPATIMADSASSGGQASASSPAPVHTSHQAGDQMPFQITQTALDNLFEYLRCRFYVDGAKRKAKSNAKALKAQASQFSDLSASLVTEMEPRSADQSEFENRKRDTYKASKLFYAGLPQLKPMLQQILGIDDTFSQSTFHPEQMVTKADLEATVSTLKAQMDETCQKNSEAIRSLTTDLDATKKEKLRADEDLAQCRAEVDNWKKSAEASRAETDQLKQRLEDVEKRFGDSETALLMKVDHAKNESDANRTNVVEHSRKIKNLEMRNDKLAAELAKSRKRQASPTKDLLSRIESIEQNAASMQRSIEGTQKTQKTMRDKHLAIVDDANREVNELRAQVAREMQELRARVESDGSRFDATIAKHLKSFEVIVSKPQAHIKNELVKLRDEVSQHSEKFLLFKPEEISRDSESMADQLGDLERKVTALDRKLATPNRPSQLDAEAAVVTQGQVNLMLGRLVGMEESMKHLETMRSTWPSIEESVVHFGEMRQLWSSVEQKVARIDGMEKKWPEMLKYIESMRNQTMPKIIELVKDLQRRIESIERGQRQPTAGKETPPVTPILPGHVSEDLERLRALDGSLRSEMSQLSARIDSLEAQASQAATIFVRSRDYQRTLDALQSVQQRLSDNQSRVESLKQEHHDFDAAVQELKKRQTGGTSAGGADLARRVEDVESKLGQKAPFVMPDGLPLISKIAGLEQDFVGHRDVVNRQMPTLFNAVAGLEDRFDNLSTRELALKIQAFLGANDVEKKLAIFDTRLVSLEARRSVLPSPAGQVVPPKKRKIDGGAMML